MSGWNLTGDRARGAGSGAGPVPSEAAAEGAISVSEALGSAQRALGKLPTLAVVGEVSGLRVPSGRFRTYFFSIKDEEATLGCKMWASVYQSCPFELSDGALMLFKGRFDVYKRNGDMSFLVDSFKPIGEGLLRKQVAELARKLEAEGLTAPERKRRVPAFCTRVAVVTSLTGAVINDVKRTLRRRNRLVEVICVDSKVQGDAAPAELASALRRAAAIEPAPDCILLVRGGGSYEDLMAFNDEALARAVAACPVPVVTGIGHESDNSICDMVADRRCSTPTAAAESVAPSIDELQALLGQREDRLARQGGKMLADADRDLADLSDRLVRSGRGVVPARRRELEALASRPCLRSPDAFLTKGMMDLDQSAARLDAAMGRSVEGISRRLAELERALPAGRALLQPRARDLELALVQLANAAAGVTSRRAARLSEAAAKLDALSPLKVLGRGYAIAYGPGGVATGVGDFEEGGPVRVRLADGEVSGTVDAIAPDGYKAGQGPDGPRDEGI